MPGIRAVSLLLQFHLLFNPGIPYLLDRVHGHKISLTVVGLALYMQPCTSRYDQVDMTEYSKLSHLVLTQSLAVLAAGLELGLLCVVCTN